MRCEWEGNGGDGCGRVIGKWKLLREFYVQKRIGLLLSDYDYDYDCGYYTLRVIKGRTEDYARIVGSGRGSKLLLENCCFGYS